MIQPTTRGNLKATRRDYILFRTIKLLVDNRKATPFFLAHIGCDTGNAVQETTFLYHIGPRKRVKEEENLRPSSFTSAPALYRYWAINREQDRIWTARKLLEKDRNNTENAHNNLKEEGLVPRKSSTSQRKSYAFLPDEQTQSVAKTSEE